MMKMKNFWSAAATCLLLAACGGTEAVEAVNPSTGEVRSFATAEDVPSGWLMCEGECPDEPVGQVDCDELDEAACLARADCEGVYLRIGAWTEACETENPPASCDDDGFRCMDVGAEDDDDDCVVDSDGNEVCTEDGSEGSAPGGPGDNAAEPGDDTPGDHSGESGEGSEDGAEGPGEGEEPTPRPGDDD